MFSKRHKSLLHQTWHPSENELLVYLDGEMDAKSSLRVEGHLKGCWSCRVKREETERLISAFMKSRASALGESSSSPAGALPRLKARLDQLDSELGAPPLFVQWIVALRRTREWSLLSARWLTVVAASALLIVVVLRMTSVPPVSAREILERTKQAETQRLQRVAGPVVYRKLQVRRASSAPRLAQAVSWEIWNDVTHSRFRQRVEDENGRRFLAGEIDSEHAIQSSSQSASAPPVLIELQQVLQANRMDIRHPLSANAYESWRRTLPHKTEEVIEGELPDGRAALTLITASTGPFANNAIKKAELVVRTDDWHLVEQRLEVQARDEVRKYELIETSFDVLALNLLPASIFADVTPLRAPLTIAPIPVLASLPETPATPSTGELITAEIESWFALHRAKACLGEALEVIREGSGVKIRGVVETAERREQLLEALRAIPLTTAEIQTVEEALTVSSSPSPLVNGSDDPAVVDYTLQPQNFKSSVQESLRRYFTEHGRLDSQRQEARSVNAQMVEFSNEVISLSQSALAEAWALRHLAEWNEPKKMSELRPQLKWLLEVMARDHTNALKTNMSRCRSRLEPVLSSIIGRLPEGDEGALALPLSLKKNSGWEARCRVLFSEVEQLDRLVRGLFADTGVAADSDDSLRKLSGAFPSIDARVAEFEAAIGGELSSRPEELSLKDKAQ
jgi:hypothetical protein